MVAHTLWSWVRFPAKTQIVFFLCLILTASWVFCDFLSFSINPRVRTVPSSPFSRIFQDFSSVFSRTFPGLHTGYYTRTCVYACTAPLQLITVILHTDTSLQMADPDGRCCAGRKKSLTPACSIGFIAKLLSLAPFISEQRAPHPCSK